MLARQVLYHLNYSTSPLQAIFELSYRVVAELWEFIFWILISYHIYDLQIFSPILGLPLSLVDSVLYFLIYIPSNNYPLEGCILKSLTITVELFLPSFIGFCFRYLDVCHEV
jgi:hypothetical protein